jgi:hypothetical protein
LLQELAINSDHKPNYTLQSGPIRYKGRIYIGNNTDLRSKIFQTFHSSLYGGPSGHRVTLHRIQQLFYWPQLKQFGAQRVAECPTCQISKTKKVQYPGLLSPLPIPQQKWTDISMDFIEGLPKSQGKNVILVVVDRLTKYTHFIPLAHPYKTPYLPAHCEKKYLAPSTLHSNIVQHTTQRLMAKPNESISASNSTSVAWHSKNPRNGANGS